MKHNIIVKNYLSSLVSLIDELNEADLAKLESGEFEISLKLVKKANHKPEVASKQEPVLVDYDQLIKELDCVKSREAGLEVIEKHLKSKNDLISFAKYIDVAFLKSEKVSKIRETIVDATVGAKLRSSAIQGKKI